MQPFRLFLTNMSTLDIDYRQGFDKVLREILGRCSDLLKKSSSLIEEWQQVEQSAYLQHYVLILSGKNNSLNNFNNHLRV